MSNVYKQNVYKQVKKIARKNNLDCDDATHALLAAVLSNCCDGCSEKLRSDHFVEQVVRMVAQIKLCRQLSQKRAAAVGE